MYSAVRRPGRMPGMKPPYFLQIVRDVHGVEDDGRVEVAEEDDGREVEQIVQRRVEVEMPQDGADPGDLIQRDEAREHLRDREDRGGEDDRDDAARVHLEREVGGHPAVLASPDHAPGVLHGDAPLRALHEDDRSDDDHHHHHQDQDLEQVALAPHDVLPRLVITARGTAPPRCPRR